MLKLCKIAITGGVASGKSLVCQFLKEYGAYVVNADKIVHQLLSPSTVIGRQVIDLLGPSIVDGDRIDRVKVGTIVFSDKHKLIALEQILHPAVVKEIETLYKQAQHQIPLPTLFVAEVPLLFEADLAPFFDAVVTVVADEKLCKTRFKKAGFPSSEYDLRMSRQFSVHEKKIRANFIIYNEGTVEELKQEVQQFYKNYIKYTK